MRDLRVLALPAIAVSACAAPPPVPERTIEIVATDYAFQVPDTLPAGSAVLRLTNRGSVPHEVIVMKLHPGSSAAEVLAAQQRGEVRRPYVDGGVAVLFADPGTTGDGRLVVTLEPGRDYALWCSFRDSETAPAHSTLGMFKQVHVAGQNGASPAVAATRRVVVDAVDYAFRLADTLAAGETDFVLTNAGLQRHEVAFGRLTAGISPAVFVDEYLKGNDVDSLFDDDGAVLTAYGAEVNQFAVRIDLLPGRSYVLICQFRDTPDAPPHAELGMVKGLEVRRAGVPGAGVADWPGDR